MAKNNLKKAGRVVKEQKEFEEEVLQIDRVTRVVKGGRRLRFRCTVAIGDRKGRVGIGVGKASEVVTGIKKAVTKAKNSLINVPITKGDTIPHKVNIKYKAARLLVMPASPGTGVIAGGALRKILNLAGIKNVLSKNLGSRNTLVNAQASIKALEALRPVKEGQQKKFTKEDQKPVQDKVEKREKRKGTPKKEGASSAEPSSVEPKVKAEDKKSDDKKTDKKQ
ncbi:30S ribosomal protein S5 [Patescibacteria group bacterium]|nr:30S ribosomal protein S5 [Patescibacteria group bacterium]MBU1683471.1 30S ribosomal protein S5 [Patescibacteria group bacterium]MBU1935580.1 30S ribosomal protein S5 [Patescibacteria group bacterium]